MVLFHNIIQIFHLPDGDGRAVLFVIAFDGGFIGVTAVNGDRLRDPVPADRLLQKPQRGLFIPMLGQQKVNGLAVLVTNRVDWSAQRIITLYLQRWPIETFYQDGKTHLGLDEYRMRNAEAIGKHWCLVFVAYSL